MPLRRLRWLVTGLTLFLLAAFIAGRWYSASMAIGRTSIGLSKGCTYYNQSKGIIDPDRQFVSAGLNGPPFSWAWWGAATDDTRFRAVSIPLWIPALPGLVVTAGLWRPYVQAYRHRRSGHCPTCGYDRRGLGDAACPECGTRGEAGPATT